MAEPWRCPDCGVEHRCDGGGGVPVPPPDPPGSGPAPITVHLKVEGSLISQRDLENTLQRAILRANQRNPRNRPEGS